MHAPASTPPTGTLFARPGSIARRVWADADLVLLVFGAAAAEFALNRAVDWLFVSGRLPADPIGRLFSTAAYAQRIALGDRGEAERTFAGIRAAHAAVEERRGARIPDWAHRDVLYMLMDYTERVFRAVHRPLAPAEQEELHDVFRRVGEGLGIPALPDDYPAWQRDRELHLERDLAAGAHTALLFAAYRRDLGAWRYALMRQVQGALVPAHVRRLLGLPRGTWLRPLLALHPLLARLRLVPLVQRALVPRAHLAGVRRLHRPEVAAEAAA